MIKDDLTEYDKEKAKQNGFILIGKKGSGKTNILNVIFDMDIRLLKPANKIIQKDVIIYFYKLKNGNCITLIDTLGFSYEFDNRNNEYIQKLLAVLSEEKIHIKSILFLINFQNERIDLVEQNVLLIFNMLFPSKMFWNNLIIIFTHYYSELEGVDKEIIKNKIENSNKKLFNQFSDKVKGVAGVINHEELNIEYYNTYWPIKNKEMANENINIKKKLEMILSKKVENEPLYSQIEIIEIKNYQINDQNTDIKYLVDIEIIGFFDFKDKPLKEYTKIISKKEITVNNIKLPKYQFNIKVTNAKINNDDNLEFIRVAANENNSHYYKYFFGENKDKDKDNILIHFLKDAFGESEQGSQKIDLFLKNKIKEKENTFINNFNKEKKNIKNIGEKNKELVKLLKNKDKQINDLTSKVNELNKKIDKLKKNLKDLERSNQQLISLIITSFDGNIHRSIICKSSDKFCKIENMIYNIYPKYKESESEKNDFFVNNRKINKLNTIEENRILDSDIILLTKQIIEKPK